MKRCPVLQVRQRINRATQWLALPWTLHLPASIELMERHAVSEWNRSPNRLRVLCVGMMSGEPVSDLNALIGVKVVEHGRQRCWESPQPTHFSWRLR